MTHEEEKAVEKQLKEYFSDSKNKLARDCALNFGIDNISHSSKIEYTEEEMQEFEQMYLLYWKTNDLEAFTYNVNKHIWFISPFTYGGYIDKKMGYPENGSDYRKYIEVAVEHNTETQLIGSIAGEAVGYATGAAVMKGISDIQSWKKWYKKS